MENLPIPDLENLIVPLTARAVRVVMILIAAVVATKVVGRVLKGFIRRLTAAIERQGGPVAERQKRSATLGNFFSKGVSIVIWTLALVMALKEVGFDIGPLLAGAGVAGLAIGFGAQSLVRDVITGVFMLVENQIGVGDVAVINGTGGQVQAVNLRTTVLRDFEGVVHVFPNGNISTIANRTQEFSNYVFDIGVAYKEDTDHVTEVLQEVARELREDSELGPQTLAPLEIVGVDRFTDSAVIIKARIKTVPGKQWAIGREMNRRIKKKFDEVGIEIPFPHQTLYFGEASKPFKLEIDQAGREEIRKIIREELAASSSAE